MDTTLKSLALFRVGGKHIFIQRVLPYFRVICFQVHMEAPNSKPSYVLQRCNNDSIMISKAIKRCIHFFILSESERKK